MSESNPRGAFYIQSVPPENAEGKLAEIYGRIADARSGVANIFSVEGMNHRALEAHFDLYHAVMFRPSPLSRIHREMAAVAVSRANDCHYGLVHHGGFLRKLAEDDGWVARFTKNPTGETRSPLEAALVAYALKLTYDPSSVGREDVQALRDAGLDDRGVLDLALVVSYFNFVIRLAEGLGVPLEPPEERERG